jgi:hypothetical protein
MKEKVKNWMNMELEKSESVKRAKPKGGLKTGVSSSVSSSAENEFKSLFRN